LDILLDGFAQLKYTLRAQNTGYAKDSKPNESVGRLKPYGTLSLYGSEIKLKLNLDLNKGRRRTAVDVLSGRASFGYSTLASEEKASEK